jgi:hypothetical protein
MNFRSSWAKAQTASLILIIYAIAIPVAGYSQTLLPMNAGAGALRSSLSKLMAQLISRSLPDLTASAQHQLR